MMCDWWLVCGAYSKTRSNHMPHDANERWSKENNIILSNRHAAYKRDLSDATALARNIDGATAQVLNVNALKWIALDLHTQNLFRASFYWLSAKMSLGCLFCVEATAVLGATNQCSTAAFLHDSDGILLHRWDAVVKATCNRRCTCCLLPFAISGISFKFSSVWTAHVILYCLLALFAAEEQIKTHKKNRLKTMERQQMT